MTQAVQARPETKTPAPAFVAAGSAPAPAIPAGRESATIAAQMAAKVKSAPWMLFLLAPIGAAPLYVSYETAHYGFGIAAACIPILLAAAFLLTTILACVFFLDEGD